MSERAHWGEPGIDGRIMLGWIFRKWHVVVWTGLGWFRIETGGRRAIVSVVMNLHVP
jgi:hypothetical protein